MDAERRDGGELLPDANRNVKEPDVEESTRNWIPLLRSLVADERLEPPVVSAHVESRLGVVRHLEEGHDLRE